MKARILAILSIVAALLAVQPATASAQTSTGDITVTVFDPFSIYAVGASLFLDGATEPSAVTDDFGNASITGITEGWHTMRAELGGFGPSADYPFFVEVGFSQHHQISLTRTTGSVTGVVTDSAGEPLQDIVVSAEAGAGGAVTGRTSASGTFSLAGVVAGSTIVQAFDSSRFFDGAEVTAEVPADASTDIVIAMTPSAPSFTGRVVGPTGEPVSGVRIDVARHEFSSSVVTRWDGRFAYVPDFPIVDPTTVTLTVSAPDPTLHFPRSQQVEIIPPAVADIEIALSAAAGIDGIVTADGAPVAGASVVVWNTLLYSSRVATTRTDADGRFRTGPLMTGGPYIVHVQPAGQDFASEWFPDQAARSHAQRFTLADGERANLEIALDRAASVSGHIVDPTGVPLEQFFVDVSAIPVGLTNDEALNERHGCNLGTYDSVGTYHIGCLHPSVDWVIYTGNEFVGEPQYHSGSPSYANATPLNLNPGEEVGGIDFQLQPTLPIVTVTGITPHVFEGGTTTRVRITGTNFPADKDALTFRIPWILDFRIAFETIEVLSPHEAIVDVTPIAPLGSYVTRVADLWARRSGGSEGQGGCGTCLMFFHDPSVPLSSTINGFVMESGFTPISGATVTIAGTTIPPATTGDDGSFSFVDVPMLLDGGEYTLEYTAPGYKPGSMPRIDVIGGIVREPYILGLSPILGQVQVKVIDDAGAPVSEARCVLQAANYMTSTTDSNGLCVFDEVETGTYVVDVFDDAGRVAPTSVEASVTRGTVVSIDVTTARITSGVRGYLTDSTGVPIGGTSITLFDENGWHRGSAITTSTGEFGFAVETPFVGRLAVETAYNRPDLLATSVPVDVTSGVGRVDIELMFKPRMQGTVRGADSEAVASTLIVRQTNGIVVGYGSSDEAGNFDFPVGGSGEVTVEVVPYDSVYAAEWFPNGMTEAEAQSFTLTPGATVTIDVIMELAATISGTVYGPDGSPTIASVSAWGDTEDLNLTSIHQSFAWTEGLYSISGLRPGSYVLKFEPYGIGAAEWYDNALSPQRATRVDVTAGEVRTGIDAGLDDRLPIEITGLSRDFFRFGSTYTDVRIFGQNFPDDPNAVTLQFEDGERRVHTTITDVVSSTEMIATITVDPSAATSATPTRISMFGSVVGYAQCTCTVYLGGENAALGELSGQVKDNRGRPVAGVTVDLIGAFGTLTAETSNAGTWSLSNVNVGSYTIRFNGTDKLAGRYWNDSIQASAATPVIVAGPGNDHGRHVISGLNARLRPRDGTPVLSTITPSSIREYFGTTLNVQGKALDPITGGFRLTAESDFGSIPMGTLSSVSSTRATFTPSLPAGTYDVVMTWTTSSGAEASSRCVKCLRVLPHLYVATWLPMPTVPVGGTQTSVIGGGGFVDLKSLTTSTAGVSVFSWKALDSGQLEVTLRASRRATPGPGTLTLSRADGSTVDIHFTVV